MQEKVAYRGLLFAVLGVCGEDAADAGVEVEVAVLVEQGCRCRCAEHFGDAGEVPERVRGYGGVGACGGGWLTIGESASGGLE